MANDSVRIKNRKASYEYQLLDTFTAGIMLTGTEIKSIRNQQASIAEAYCAFIRNELWVRNMHIAEYENGSYSNHEPKRDRKLLLQRTELNKLHKKLKEKGLTIVPTLLFINDQGLAKLQIALAQGKKLYDKREDKKSKDVKREMDRAMKNY
ncbi:MAG: SsrA-binding protein SmpB [Bacteroidota bacterium]